MSSVTKYMKSSVCGVYLHLPTSMALRSRLREKTLDLTESGATQLRGSLVQAVGHFKEL